FHIVYFVTYIHKTILILAHTLIWLFLLTTSDLLLKAGQGYAPIHKPNNKRWDEYSLTAQNVLTLSIPC
ncbi:hypothetical protein C7E22_05120, partial [Vibrio sp. V02_P2A34T13]